MSSTLSFVDLRVLSVEERVTALREVVDRLSLRDDATDLLPYAEACLVDEQTLLAFEERLQHRPSAAELSEMLTDAEIRTNSLLSLLAKRISGAIDDCAGAGISTETLASLQRDLWGESGERSWGRVRIHASDLVPHIVAVLRQKHHAQAVEMAGLSAFADALRAEHERRVEAMLAMPAAGEAEKLRQQRAEAHARFCRLLVRVKGHYADDDGALNAVLQAFVGANERALSRRQRARPNRMGFAVAF